MERKEWLSHPYVISGVIGILGACLYLPTLQFGFVNLDDPWLIRENVTLQHWGWSNLHAIWCDLSTGQRLRLGGEYLPVRDMSVMMDFLLFGDWIGGFHLTNILLYGLLCAGVAGLILTWMKSPLLAWMAGSFYAVHPLHVEAVAWLSERKGLLAGVLLMSALLLFRRFASRGSWLVWLAATLSFVLAIWSKALAITGIGILAALLWFFFSWQGNSPKDPENTPEPKSLSDDGSKSLSDDEFKSLSDDEFKSLSDDGSEEASFLDVSPTRFKVLLGWVLFSVCGFLAFVPVWLAGQRMSMIQGFHGGSWWATLRLMTKVHGLYWQQLFFATGLGIKYPIQPGQGFSLLSFFGVLLFLLLLVILVTGLLRPRWQVAAFASSCWFIFFAPVSQLIFPLQNFIADRYMLLPSLAFTLLLAEGLRQSFQSLSRNVVWGFVLLLASSLTLGQMFTWRSTRTMYLQALEVHPTWVAGMMQLAHIEGKKGRLKQAQRWVERARKINPYHPKVALRASILLLRQGKVKQATDVLLRAVKTSKNDKIRSNLALLLQRQGRLKEALRWAQEAVSIRPLLVHNQRTLGVVALHAKKLDVAEKAFQTAIRLQPKNAQNLMNMVALLMQRGQKEKAKSLWHKAQRMIQQQRQRRR